MTKFFYDPPPNMYSENLKTYHGRFPWYANHIIFYLHTVLQVPPQLKSLPKRFYSSLILKEGDSFLQS